MSALRILLADDQATFRTGLSDLLGSVDGITIVGQAENGSEAVTRAEQLNPDLVLMDIRMPGMDGMEATRRIRQRVPNARVIVLTTFDDERLVAEAVRAGAVGYLLKGTPLEEMLDVLRLAARGYATFAPGVRPPEAGAAQPDASALNEREREIWALIGQGLTNRDVAQRLALSEGTVKNYASNILAALGVRHRTEAAILWQLRAASLAPAEQIAPPSAKTRNDDC